ncbi:MAG: ABC transporter ATP-binding protein [Bacteroidetes bacterium]|nr:ABC transporter ATP-binding protein [Bacteroidota bacterium]
MNSIELISENISKTYSGKVIFKNLSLKLAGGDSLTVLGRNGSGKSTLIKILAGLISANRGDLFLKENNVKVERGKWYSKIGLISPYLNLYDELSAVENLEFFCGLRDENGSDSKDRINSYLNKVGLYEKRNEPVKNYSSGMKQKLKLIFAVINEPKILFMDEPRTNLDSEGIKIVYETAESHRENGILIVATNDADDIELCSDSLNIEDYK